MPKYRKFYVKATESWDINDMPDDFTRLLWVMLPLGLCREGRGVDNPAWIKAKIFPLRQDVTAEMINAATDWYTDRGMVERYEVGDRKFFRIVKWHEHQGSTVKEAESIYPPPPQDETAEQSEPSPELVKSESGTDSVCSIQYLDSDSQSPSGEKSPTASTPPDDDIEWPIPSQPEPQTKAQRIAGLQAAAGVDVLEGAIKTHANAQPDEWVTVADAFCACIHGIRLDDATEAARRNWPRKLKTIAENIGASSGQLIGALRVMPEKESGVAFKIPGSYSSPYSGAFEPDITMIVAKMAAGQIVPKGQQSKSWSKSL